ncbi:DNA-binding protein K10-like [Belonocnema kinseyi]|uniref:DNA-binding protein K10-like n=1 Tax=Belonocnema kinseyi TaxID=2817044 RepID=UPI00143DF77A|nr:DNA-binding protein K10-like [Belonocnema kinseyi]
MSPLNWGGSPLEMRGPPMAMFGMRPPPPRFGGRMPMPPRPPPPMGGMFPPMPMRPMRPRMPPPRPGTIMRPGGPLPMFGPRFNFMNFGPHMGFPMMGPRGPRGLLLRPGPRAMPPPKVPPGNNALKNKAINAKKAVKLEEIDLKKPWMTVEIRSEIQKKNKLYAKAKKSKDSKEWEEFKDLRNKVTRMIRDAKNVSEKKSENKATTPVQKATLNQESSKVEKVQESANGQVPCPEKVQVAVAE